MHFGQRNARRSERLAAIEGGLHPERWRRWLQAIETRLEFRSARAFEQAVLDHVAPPAMSLPGKWSVSEVRGRGGARRAWQAYWVGEGVRALQRARDEDPRSWVSGAESLAFGGYYGDLIALIALQLHTASAQTVGAALDVAGIFGQPAMVKTVAELGVHGPSIVVPDYDAMLGSDIACFAVDDTPHLNEAYTLWRRRKRDIALGATFTIARVYLQYGQENRALEAFWDAVAEEAFRHSDLTLEIGVPDIPGTSERALDLGALARRRDADAARSARRFYGADGSNVLSREAEVDD